MSGHSKWSTIKRQKGTADIKRGQTFAKIANAITIAARLGGAKLRDALESARKVNMPKENVQRAIDHGLGRILGQMVEEVAYEGFGPGRSAFYVEGITNNRLRTSQEVKNLLERSGGSLGGQGSTSYMFDQKGEIKVKGKGNSVEEEMLELIDLGVEEVEDYQEDGIQKYLVYVESPKLNTIGNKITQAGYDVESKEVVLTPNTVVDIHDEDTAKKVVSLAERLEEHDDVQKVYANFNIPENLLN